MRPRRRRSAAAAIAVVAATVLVFTLTACSDDDDSPEAGATPGETAAATAAVTAAATSGATSAPTAGGTAASTAAATESVAPTATAAGPREVQGVVGAVNTGTSTITIRPTSGGDFPSIVVDAETEIRRAGGGSAELADIRPSDRILAVGVPGDDAGTLLASSVTIQQVIPGPQPGG